MRGGVPGPTRVPCNTRLPLREVQRLGQDVRQLGRSWHADKRHVTVPDHFVREALRDVNDGLAHIDISISMYLFRMSMCAPARRWRCSPTRCAPSCPRTPRWGLASNCLKLGEKLPVVLLLARIGNNWTILIVED